MPTISPLEVPGLATGLTLSQRRWYATASALALELDREVGPHRWIGTSLHRELAGLAAGGPLDGEEVLDLLARHGCPDTRRSRAVAGRIAVTVDVLQMPIHRRRGDFTITPGIGGPGQKRRDQRHGMSPWTRRRW